MKNITLLFLAALLFSNLLQPANAISGGSTRLDAVVVPLEQWQSVPFSAMQPQWFQFNVNANDRILIALSGKAKPRGATGVDLFDASGNLSTESGQLVTYTELSSTHYSTMDMKSPKTATYYLRIGNLSIEAGDVAAFAIFRSYHTSTLPDKDRNWYTTPWTSKALELNVNYAAIQGLPITLRFKAKANSLMSFKFDYQSENGNYIYICEEQTTLSSHQAPGYSDHCTNSVAQLFLRTTNASGVLAYKPSSNGYYYLQIGDLNNATTTLRVVEASGVELEDGTVLAGLSAISISGPISVTSGSNVTYAVTATYDDNSTKPVMATWSFTGSGATIDSTTGVLTVGGGIKGQLSGTITAIYSEAGVTKTALLPVSLIGATNCVYTVSPTSLILSASKTTNGLTITASSNTCQWTASSSQSWLHASPTSGIGTMNTQIIVDENASNVSRQGNLLIAGQNVPVTQSAATVAGIAGIDCIMNWAEKIYPDLFSPASTSISSDAYYYYRYYANTKAYLGISIASQHLLYLGPWANNSLRDLGLWSDWRSQANC